MASSSTESESLVAFPFRDSFWANSGSTPGLEVLLRVLKTNSDFTRDASALLQERVDLQLHYAKSLARISSKLRRMCEEAEGGGGGGGDVKSIGDAATGNDDDAAADASEQDAAAATTTIAGWSVVAQQMESESSIHKLVAHGIEDEIIRPTKSLIETQTRKRKRIESEAALRRRAAAERRGEEAKAKRAAAAAWREAEKAEAAVDGRNSPSSSPAPPKDRQKLESRLKKSTESLIKTEMDYYSSSRKAEMARQESESAHLAAASSLHVLESARVSAVAAAHRKYAAFLGAFVDAFLRIHAALASVKIDVVADIVGTVRRRGTGGAAAELLLPTPAAAAAAQAAEETDAGLDIETVQHRRRRRRQNLDKWAATLSADLAAEEAAKDDATTLLKAYSGSTEDPVDDAARNDAAERRRRAGETADWLRATLRKIQGARREREEEEEEEGSSWMEEFFEDTLDKTGTMQWTMRIPRGRRESEGEGEEEGEEEEERARAVPVASEMPWPSALK